MAVAVAVAVAVSEGGAVAVAVAGLTKIFLNRIQKSLNQCLGLCGQVFVLMAQQSAKQPQELAKRCKCFSSLAPSLLQCSSRVLW